MKHMNIKLMVTFGAFLLIAAWAILFSSVFFSGCTSEGRTPIRIGVNAWPPCELWYIAKEQGFFGTTNVELVRFSSWRDNMLSLYKGQTDITHASYFNALFYSEKGEKARIILRTETIEGGEGFVVKKNITGPEDLRGKTVAVETGTDEHFLLHKALALFGLAPSDINIVSVSSEEAARKFINNEADACFTYEPFMTEAVSKGNGRVVSTTKDYPGFMIDVLAARTSVLEKRPKDIINIIHAWYRAQEYVKQNPDAAFKLMAANENMPAKDFGSFYSYFTFYDLADNASYLKSASLYDKLGEMNDFLVAQKFLTTKADLKSIVETYAVDSLVK